MLVEVLLWLLSKVNEAEWLDNCLHTAWVLNQFRLNKLKLLDTHLGPWLKKFCTTPHRY